MTFSLPSLIANRKKNAPGFKILAFALGLSVFSVTLIFNLTLGIKTILFRDASLLLGADMILESPDPLSEKVKTLAHQQGLETAELSDFFSMVVAGQKMELATVSAIKGNFPLRGKLGIQGAQLKKEERGPPPSGEIWVEDGLLIQLGISLGDTLTVGEMPLTVSGVIRERPIATSDWSAFTSFTYVNEQDLEKMKVLQSGSRATYRLLVAGPEEALMKFQIAAKKMLNTEIKWVTPSSGRAAVDRTLKFAERYLSLILLIQVLLAGMAIALTAHQHSLRMQREVALWRCLGASHRSVILNHVQGYALLALGVMGVSISLAYFATYEIVQYAKQWGDYAFPLHWQGIGIGVGLGLLLLGGFGLPPLMALKQISSKIILQQAEQSELKINITWYVVSILLIILLFAGAISDKEIALKFSAQIIVLSAVVFGFTYALWNAWEPISKKGPLAWRLATSYLIRYRGPAVLQCVVFTLVIMLLILVYIFQSDFLKSWKAELPPSTPNYFLLNIQAEEVDNIQVWFSQKGINEVKFSPIVRGMLTEINGEAIDKLRHNGRSRGLNRPINLTWLRELPEDNKLIDGVEWNTIPNNVSKITVEKEFADRQGVKVGDTFTFDIVGNDVKAEIVQIRTVQWESYRPNFFVIFPPGVLENYPHSFMSSLYVAVTEKPFMFELVRDYPKITVIDIDAILEKVRYFTGKLALALTALLSLVGALGIVIMYASILSTLKERIHESALLKILGGQNKLIRRIFFTEFMMLGAISGFLGSIASLFIAHYLAKYFFLVPFSSQLKWIMLGTVGGLVMVPLFGMLGAKEVFSASALRLFRQTQ